MEEKIKETKIAILNRIIRAVNDDSKTIPVESLKELSFIVNMFDDFEMDKNKPVKNPTEEYNEFFSGLINIMDKINTEKKTEEEAVAPVVVEAGV